MPHFSDDDIFPFACASCGYKIQEPIRSLKANLTARCLECGARNWFYEETLLRALDEAERAINDFERNVRFGQEDT